MSVKVCKPARHTVETAINYNPSCITLHEDSRLWLVQGDSIFAFDHQSTSSLCPRMCWCSEKISRMLADSPDLRWRLSPRILTPPAHPLAPQQNQVGEEEERQTDSGFGSGGFSLSSECYYKPLSRCENDMQKLQVNEEELQQSCFYLGQLDSDAARKMLKHASVGTFLVRNSADPRYLYSLSVKTDRGATSIRILYERGLFQFDCDRGIKDRLPRFESVLAMVDFYVLLSQAGGNRVWRWEDISGNRHMKMTLTKPHRSTVPSLGHLARLKVNQCLKDVFLPQLSVDKLPVNQEIKNYIQAYPYRS